MENAPRNNEASSGTSPVERGVRRVQELQKGDRFTIEGWGTSAHGHQVCNGRSVKTGRRMKVRTLQVFVVTKPSA